MKLYTKTGDKGETSLLSGGRVPKFHDRIEAYGTIDELSSFIGLLKNMDIDNEFKLWLTRIQEKLLILGSKLSDQDDSVMNLKKIDQNDVDFLEKNIDYLDRNLPTLKEFVIAGNNKSDAICHICRTICRRAERRVIKLSQTNNINDHIIKYLNRLSDFFFVLARKI